MHRVFQALCSQILEVHLWRVMAHLQGALLHCKSEADGESQTSISKSNNEGGGKANSKRLLSNASFNELLDDDLRTQAKRARKLDRDDKVDDLVVPPRTPNQLRASMLPISLREKFGYLFST